MLGPTQHKALSPALVERTLRITEGWAAGLVLLMERLRTSGLASEDLDHFTSGELFDYFATELFGKTDAETQAFLLKTAFLLHISPQTARELTGNENAGVLLASLSRNHFFTERRSMTDPVYQYHPLFGEFLRARACATYSRDTVLTIRQRAAHLLEGAGHLGFFRS